MRALLTATALACAAVVFGATGPSAAREPSRVVDRTLSCTTGAALGARTVNVSAQAGLRKNGSFAWLAQAVITTPGDPVARPRNDYLPTLVGVTAGWPPPPPLPSGGLGIDARRCGSSKATVPLSRRALRGGLASQLGVQLKCYAPERVLIRVESVFRSPVTLTLDRKQGFFSANARIARARIAVRTPEGKPLVYADVVETGKVLLYTARGCF
jgi:hypothetical protein